MVKVVDHLEENLNQLEVGAESARTVAEAIQVLGGDHEEIDKHPEKRMKAAYLVSFLLFLEPLFSFFSSALCFLYRIEL